MKKNYPKAILLTLASLTFQLAVTGKLHAQCSGSVPSFAVDLTGKSDSMWISPAIQRAGLCCGASNPDVCIEFIITLDTGSNGFILDIYSGAAPGGSLYYSIGCLGSYPVGKPICLSGVGPHKVTFCKPGNNTNQYYIKALPKPSISPDVIASQACKQQLFVRGLEPDSVTWTSVPSNATYNSYLSCTSGCDTVDVTPSGSFPSSVLYRGCGTVLGGCTTNKFCDTVRVKFVNSLAVDIAPKNKYICFGNTNAVLKATPTGGLPPYKYLWSNGSTSQSITVGAGTYSVSLTDSMNCSIALDTAIVNAYTMAILALPGNDTSVCSDQTSLALKGFIQSAGGGKWLGNGTFAPSDTILNARYTYTAAEKAAGFAKIYLATTYNNGCPPDTAGKTITFNPTPAPIISGPDSFCSNRTATYSVTVVSGSTYNWAATGGTITSGIGTNSINILWGAGGSGTVSITQISNMGCDSFVSKTIVKMPTPAPVIAGPDSVCADKPYTYSVAFNNTWKYKWVVTGGTIIGVDNKNSMLVRWAGPGSGNVKITVTSAFGCDSSRTKSIVIMPTPIPVIAGPATTCSNKIYSYSVTAIAGCTYQWSTVGGSIIGSNTANTVSVQWGASGTGTLKIVQTSAFGCDSPATISVTIEPSPAPVLVGPLATCSNKIYTYSVTAYSGHTYAWTVTGGSIIKGQSTNSIDVQWGASGSGNVTIKQTSDKGCDSTLSKTVTIQPTPAPVISGPVAGCSNKTYTYSITTIAGSTYSWTANGGTIQGSSTNNSINVLWGASGTGSVTVKQTSSVGCDSTISMSITIKPTPAPVISGPDSFCSNRSATYNISTIAGSTYNWTAIGGTIQGSNTNNSINVLWGASGSGSVTVKQTSSFGCDSTISKNVTIMSTPAPVIAGPDSICADKLYTYSVAFNASWNYKWVVTGGSIVGADNSNSMLVRWAGPGTGNVKITITSVFGCDSSRTKSTVIMPTPIPVIAGPATTCSNKIYSYSVTSIAGSKYQWSIAGGSIIGSNNANTVSVQWGASGTGTLKIVQTSSFGCDSPATISVNIQPSPNPVLVGPAATCSNKISTYSVTAISGHSYAWTIAGGIILKGQSSNSIDVQWGTSGAGKVTITQTSDKGCDSTLSLIINIQPTPAPVVSGPDSTCSNRIYTYSVTAIPGSTYNWIITRGTIIGSSSGNSIRILWGADGLGLISVMQKSAAGCDSMATMDVMIMPTPNPSIAGTDNTCSNRVYTYSVLSVTGSKYSWQANGGMIVGPSNKNAVNVLWGPSGSGQISVTQVSDFGCDSTISKTINIMPTPAPVITGNGNVCSNRSNLYAITPIPGSTYLWSVTGGKIQGSNTGNTINVLWGASGGGQVQVKQTSAQGCDSTITISINIQATPDPEIQGPDNVCSNRVATYSANFTPGHNYIWTASGGSIQGVSNTYNVNVLWDASGIGTIRVLESSPEGCDSLLQMPVNILPTPNPVINGNDKPCQNKPYQYSVPVVSGHTYNWQVTYGKIVGSATSNAIQVVWDLTGNGSISVRQTSPAGCDSTIKKTIQILPTPVPVIFGLANTCQDKTYKYAVSDIPGHTYLWSVNGGSVVGNNTFATVFVKWGNSGVGTLTIRQTSNFGCDSTVSRKITITTTPAPVINGPGISCQNYVSEYTSGTSMNGIGHFWRVNGGRIVGFMNRDTVRVAWDSAGPQWIQLTLTSPLGCDSTVTRNIQVNANPVLTVTGPNVVCENHTYLYQSTYVVDMAYIWTLNGGGRFAGNTSPSNIYVDMFAAGKYELSLKYRNSNGCEGNAKFPVQVVDFPIPKIDGSALGCANTKGNTYSGNTYSLVNKKGSPLKYEWLVIPAVNFSVTDETTISVDWGAPGIYTIALRQINTITGCDDTAKFFVEVDSIVKPKINSGDFTGCQPLNVDLIESTGASGLDYTWYLENGIVHNKSLVNNTFTKVGPNPVKLVVTNKYGCKDSVKINVELYPKPKAAFDITSPAPYYSDDTINFKNKSTGAEYYLWDFGDQEISYQKDARHRFNEAVDHTVWLYAESLQGCRDSVSKKLRIMLKPQIFVPNAFTPGIDKLNDKFTISTRNIDRFNILIYNRWGQIIFRSDKADFEWDGTYQSLPVMDGVYPYLINANGHQGERFVLTGEINVIR